MSQARAGKKQLKFGKPSPVNFNLMVVGETGAGKTTFLKTLFKSYCDDEIIKTGLSQETSKTVKIEDIGSFTLETPSLDINVHLYDSPGYGDCINNLNAIETVREYLENAHRSWFETNGNQMTEKDRNAADVRIHCVFYFIAPHRIKEIDKEFIKQLTGLAPIVPVIGKADTMKISERCQHLLAVHAMLREFSRTCDAPIAFDFHEQGDYFLDTPVTTSTQAPAASAPSPAPAPSPAATPAAGAPYTSMHVASDAFDLSGSMVEEDEQGATNVASYIDCSTTSTEEGERLPQSEHQHQKEAQPAAAEGIPHVPSTASFTSQASLHTSQLHVPLPRVRGLFAVVCDTSASGKREYPWGSLDIYDEEHSDTRRLQRLMFESDNITAMRATAQEMSVHLYHPLNAAGCKLDGRVRRLLREIRPYVDTTLSVAAQVKGAANKVLLAFAWFLVPLLALAFLSSGCAGLRGDLHKVMSKILGGHFGGQLE